MSNLHIGVICFVRIFILFSFWVNQWMPLYYFCSRISIFFSNPNPIIHISCILLEGQSNISRAFIASPSIMHSALFFFMIIPCMSLPRNDRNWFSAQGMFHVFCLHSLSFELCDKCILTQWFISKTNCLIAMHASLSHFIWTGYHSLLFLTSNAWFERKL